jgi:hypothetical protein
MQKNDKADKSKDSAELSWSSVLGFGEILLIMSLAMDGFTGAIQDKMNAGHKPDPHSMMLNMNVWSCLYLFIGKLNCLIAKKGFCFVLNIYLKKQ